MHSTPSGLSSFFLFGWRFLAAFSLGASSPRLMLSSYQSTCGLSLHTAGCFLTPNCPADCASTLLCRIGCFLTPCAQRIVPPRRFVESENRRRIGGREEDLDFPTSSGCMCLVCFDFGFDFDFWFLVFFLSFWCVLYVLVFAFFLWW